MREKSGNNDQNRSFKTYSHKLNIELVLSLFLNYMKITSIVYHRVFYRVIKKFKISVKY
jgi:hypothetical protein